MGEEGLPNQASAAPTKDVSRVARNAGTVQLKLDLVPLIERVLQLLAQLPQADTLPLDQGMLECLQGIARTETDPLRKQHLSNLLNDLRTYFYAPSRDEPQGQGNDGQVILVTSPDCFTAALTLIPPRGGGNVPTVNKVIAALEKAGIKHGIDIAAVNRALDTMRNKNDIVWQAVVAKGESAIPGKPTWIEFKQPVIDKNEFRKNLAGMTEAFKYLRKPVKEGEAIGRIREPELGVAGKDVFGHSLYPTKVERQFFEFGESIQQNKNILTAQAAGYIMLDGNRVDIIPLYVIEEPGRSTFSADLTFPGAVVVKGNAQGPGQLNCEDVYILGNCEQMNVTAQGDVFISGGIIGHQQSLIDADGGIYASFVSEAKISALGEISVVNAIINSRVTSNDLIRVTSEKGLITGGTIQALKEIIVRTIGSEFGMMTETVVGKDFLTTQRLGEIAERVKLHEDNLRRIQELKSELARARVRVEQLPPDKQEIFIGVLRKESQSQAELRSLARRRTRLTQSLKDFLTASIQVLDSIYPPTRVQIVNEIMEIKKHLNAVTLQYDKNVGIVSSFSEESNKEPT